MDEPGLPPLDPANLDAPPGAPPSAPPPPATAQPRDVPFNFNGVTSEYFRIWIVNAALTVVTAGIYAAWAKVRNNRYIYNHLELEGHSFDYLANPKRILIGNLILAVFFVAYVGSSFLHPFAPLVTLVIFGLFFPWFIYKALRFRAHNTSYRNIRFRFTGTLADSYLINLILMLAFPFTFGLIYPYISFRRREYFYQNVWFGGTPFSFAAEAGKFYKFHLASWGIVMLGYFATMGLTIAVTAFNAGFEDLASPSADPAPLFIAVIYICSIPAFLGLALAAQFLKAILTNYCLENVFVPEGTRFRSDLKVWKLFWITMTNLLAIVVSFGFLIPWAKLRLIRYMANVISIVTIDDFDTFTKGAETSAAALGDAAIEFADFEIGF